MLTKGAKKYWGVCDSCQVALVSDKFQEGVMAKLLALSNEDPVLIYTPPYHIFCHKCSTDPDGAKKFGRAARRVARHYGINPMEVKE
jgi:hypothetical protein